MKYSTISTEARIFTFEEFIEFGKYNGGNIVDGLPWSFKFYGNPVTHENNNCYLISNPNNYYKFTTDDVLLIFNNGEVLPCNKDLFKKIFKML